MKHLKIAASFSLIILIFAFLAASFHHHEDFENHSDICSICLIALNFFSFAPIEIVLLVLFIILAINFSLSKSKIKSPVLLNFLSRAPPTIF